MIFFLWFINLFPYVARSCSNIFSLDFRLPEFFFLLWAHPSHHFSSGPSLTQRRLNLPFEVLNACPGSAYFKYQQKFF